MKMNITLVIACAVLAAGCGKVDSPKPVTPASPMKQNKLDETPVVPVVPMPKVSADANQVTGPTPGQANDHSSPAFKDGGVPDKKK